VAGRARGDVDPVLLERVEEDLARDALEGEVEDRGRRVGPARGAVLEDAVDLAEEPLAEAHLERLEALAVRGEAVDRAPDRGREADDAGDVLGAAAEAALL